MRPPGAALALQTCTDAADLVAKDDPVLGHHAVVSAADYQEGGPPPSAAVGYYLLRFGNSILATA